MQDLQRINSLIDQARVHCATGNDATIAGKLGIGPKVLSNWRTGHKTPSIEAQCDLAAIGGSSVPKTALLSMIETAEGPRQRRFAEALKQQLDLERDKNQVLRAKLDNILSAHDIASKTTERLARIDETRGKAGSRSRTKIELLIAQLDPADELQAGAAKMLQSMLEAFPRKERDPNESQNPKQEGQQGVVERPRQ